MAFDLENILVDEESPFENSAIFLENITPTEKSDSKKKDTDEVPDEVIVDDPDNIFADNIGNNIVKSTEDGLDKTPINKNAIELFTSALVEEGVLTTATPEDIAAIKSSADLLDLVTKEVTSRLDEKQRRIDEALNAGVEVDDIKQFEGLINFLDTVEEDSLVSEDEEATTLRHNIIMQDFLNKGFTKERALRETKKSFDAGTDIDDAKEALVDNKAFYQKKYKEAIKSKKDIIDAEKQSEITLSKKIEDKILKEKELIPGIELNETMRKKIVDNLYKPVYTDKDGVKFTAIQKFQKENPEEYRSKIAIIYTLTDGFKDMTKLVGPIVNKQNKKVINELDTLLSSGKSGNNNGLQLFNSLHDDNANDTGTFELDIN
jgi:hypothetical protein